MQLQFLYKICSKFSKLVLFLTIKSYLHILKSYFNVISYEDHSAITQASYYIVTGILKKWQLIFYGTSTNPIRIRTRQFNPVHQSAYLPSHFVHYPFTVDDDPLQLSGYPGNRDFFSPSTFQSYQGPYSGAASNLQASVATLDGSSAPILSNHLPGDVSSASAFDSPSAPSSVQADGSLDTTRRILHDCDPQCDAQGCYGKGPTQCVACKNYRLDK